MIEESARNRKVKLTDAAAAVHTGWASLLFSILTYLLSPFKLLGEVWARWSSKVKEEEPAVEEVKEVEKSEVVTSDPFIEAALPDKMEVHHDSADDSGVGHEHEEIDEEEELSSGCECQGQTQGQVLPQGQEDDAKEVMMPELQENSNDSGQTEGSTQEDEDVTPKLVQQLETMFSDEHLAKDGFLLKHIRRRSDGYVSLKLVAGLRKVKQITRDFPTVLNALQLSTELDVNLDGTKVRRVEPLTPELMKIPVSSSRTQSTDDLTSEEMQNRVNMLSNGSREPRRRNSRRNSSSNPSTRKNSRNGSFSAQGQIPDLFYRKITPEDFLNHRRGSLPVHPENGMSSGNYGSLFPGYHRNSLYARRASEIPAVPMPPPREKSNSYCEGTGGSSGSETSAWLQKRMASARSSEGSINLTGVLRQPRGPDGSNGFGFSSGRTRANSENQTQGPAPAPSCQA